MFLFRQIRRKRLNWLELQPCLDKKMKDCVRNIEKLKLFSYSIVWWDYYLWWRASESDRMKKFSREKRDPLIKSYCGKIEIRSSFSNAMPPFSRFLLSLKTRNVIAWLHPNWEEKLPKRRETRWLSQSTVKNSKWKRIPYSLFMKRFMSP
jgi:hypothetical protein